MIAFTAVLVALGGLLYCLAVRGKDLPPPEPVSPTQGLEERKAAIYENLRDLQFEYRLGKLSDKDYELTKLGLQKELAAVLAEFDKLAGKPAPPPPPKPPNQCPHCQAKFDQPLKFCGECGKPMTAGAAS
jgi:hypothetical protein